MKLLTRALLSTIPKMRSQENVKDPLAVVKFFNPSGSGTWYVLEYDGVDTFFGYVKGLQEDELGYFSLSELAAFRGPYGLGIERDLYFHPTKLSELK